MDRDGRLVNGAAPRRPPRLAYPIKTYEVIGVKEARSPAFTFDFDPSAFGPEEAAAAREALRRALGVMELEVEESDGTPAARDAD